MPQDLDSKKSKKVMGINYVCQVHHYRGERFSSKWQKLALL